MSKIAAFLLVVATVVLVGVNAVRAQEETATPTPTVTATPTPTVVPEGAPATGYGTMAR
jgi:hypothetical protein